MVICRLSHARPPLASYRIDGDALALPNCSRISRADLADFMMQPIDNPQWIQKCVYFPLVVER